MSSHCNRYPSCGCGSEIGTKCDLPDGHSDLVRRNEKGYPLDEKGGIDWKRTSLEKEVENYSSDNVIKKMRARGSNYTPPKKKRK